MLIKRGNFSKYREIEQPFMRLLEISGYSTKHMLYNYSLYHSRSEDKHFGTIFIKVYLTVPILSTNKISYIVHCQNHYSVFCSESSERYLTL